MYFRSSSLSAGIFPRSRKRRTICGRESAKAQSEGRGSSGKSPWQGVPTRSMTLPLHKGRGTHPNWVQTASALSPKL